MKKVKVKSKPEDAGKMPALLSETMRVPYAMVRPDPNQPRKTFSEASLAELADSIREQGIIQPLILEHVPALYRIIEPELHHPEWRVEELKDGHWYRAFGGKTKESCVSFAGTLNLEEHYRIVAGERRWRAAGIVKLAELPAMVHRGLTDKQRFAIQFIENNQRENVTAIEEAEAMAGQLASRRKDKPDFSPEDLAKELGISRAGCYERLKLTRLHPPVRAALLAGKISTSVAGEVAKLPTPKAQEKLLEELTENLEFDAPMSVRDVQDLIAQQYSQNLADAPFDTKLTYGNSKDGILDACTNCPHRTGNMLAEFPELKTKPNVCTKPECYQGKVRSYWLEQAKDEVAKGTVVLTEKEFKSERAKLSPVDEYIYPIGRHGTIESLLGKHKPEVVMVMGETGPKKYFRKDQLPEAFKAAKLKFREVDNSTATPEEKAKAAAKEKEQRELGERRREFVKGRLPELGKRLAKLKATEAVALAWKLISSSEQFYDDAFESFILPDKCKDPQVLLLARLLSDDCNLPLSQHRHEWEEQGVEHWKELGIDLVKEFTAYEKQKSDWEDGKLPLDKHPDQELLNPEVAPAKSAKKLKMSAAAKAKLTAKLKSIWAKRKALAKGNKKS